MLYIDTVLSINNKLIKILMVLVLMIAIVPAKASANTGYNHNELLEYKGYGESMYEAIVEETTFITGQYTENKEYVGESINQVKDYANFWLDEQKKINNTCGGTSLFTKTCAGELVTSGAGYLLTVGDFIKNMFGDFEKETNPVPEIDYSFYGNVFELNGSNLMVKDGWKVYVGFPDGMDLIIGNGNIDGFSLSLDGRDSLTYMFEVKVFQQYSNNYSTKSEPVPYGDETWATMYEYLTQVESNVGSFVSFILSQGVSIRTEFDGETRNPTTINHGDKDFSKINNYIQNELANKPIKVPEPKPYLNCPNGSKIEMSISGSTFLSADGQVMLVNKDGTANVSSEICSLGWETPKMGYQDGKAVMEDKDKNLIDMLTGEILCMFVAGKECSIDKLPGKDKVQPLDTSLLAYIKNAYKYATESLKVATDGLKSLANGAKDLTSLFGVFFSWLPREMVVLMSSGLGLMIALRLFRK